MKKNPFYSILLISIFVCGQVFSQTDNPSFIQGDASQWYLFTKSNSKLPNNMVNALFSYNDKLWVGTDAGVAIIKDTITSTIKAADGLLDERIKSIIVDANGWAWIGTLSEGVHKYKQGQPLSIYSTSTAAPGKMPNNAIWGIAEYNATSPNIWFATSNGVAQLLGTTVSSFSSSNTQMESNDITSIDIDHSTSAKVRWIGTKTNGLWRRDGTSWLGYQMANSEIPSDNIRNVKVVGGIIYIGTDGGFAKFEDPKWTVYNKSNSNIPSNRVNCVMPDLGDNIWIGTDAGLVRFDGTNWHVYNVTNTKGAIPSNAINTIALDDSNYVWVGTSGGLSKFQQRVFNQCTDTLLCSGDNTEFTIKKSATFFPITYQWQVNIGGGWANTSDGGSYLGSKTGTLKLSNASFDLDSAKYRCIVKLGSLPTDTSNSLRILVKPAPTKPTVDKVLDKLFSSSAESYQWYYAWEDILIPGATNQSHTPGLPTTYYVIIGNTYGCFTKSDTIWAAGNSLNSLNYGIELFPNPSNGTFVIKGNTGTEKIIGLSIMNSAGQQVFAKNLSIFANELDEKISLDVPAGIYLLKLSDINGKTKSIKLKIE